MEPRRTLVLSSPKLSKLPFLWLCPLEDRFPPHSAVQTNIDDRQSSQATRSSEEQGLSLAETKFVEVLNEFAFPFETKPAASHLDCSHPSRDVDDKRFGEKRLHRAQTDALLGRATPYNENKSVSTQPTSASISLT